MIEWLNTIVAVAGFIIALVALWQTARSNRASQEANNISREANTIAKLSMQMQEDEGKVRLVVQPKLMQLVGDGEDRRVRPVVSVVNLSAFPVTIEKIYWKTTSGMDFIWINPRVNSKSGTLPARLESHQSLTALGNPDSFKSVEDLLSVTAAVACTECGEVVEGMTPQWQEHCAKAKEKGTLHWD